MANPDYVVTATAPPIYQGDTWEWILPVVDADGAALDWDTWTPTCHIKTGRGATIAVLEAPTVDTDVAGEIRLTLTKAETAALLAGTYVYDVQVDDTTVAYTTHTGPIEVVEQVTAP